MTILDDGFGDGVELVDVPDDETPVMMYDEEGREILNPPLVSPTFLG